MSFWEYSEWMVCSSIGNNGEDGCDSFPYDAKDKLLNYFAGHKLRVRITEFNAVKGSLPAGLTASSLVLDISKGGKVKVTGSLPDGTSVRASTYVDSNVADEDGYVYGTIPVYLPTSKNKGGIGFQVELCWDPDAGEIFADIGGYDMGQVYWHKAKGADNLLALEMDCEEYVSGMKDGYYKFSAYCEGFEDYVDSLNTEGNNSWTEAYPLEDEPICYNIKVSKGRITVPKATPIRLTKVVEDGDIWYETSSSGWQNPCGLKLKYDAKKDVITGSYVASYVIYTWKTTRIKVDGEWEERDTCTAKLKSVTIKVTGIPNNDDATLSVSAPKMGGGEGYLERQEGLVYVDEE